MGTEKRGRGRPKIDKPKNHQVNLRFDDDEIELITQLQYDLGMVKSDVVRAAIRHLYSVYND